jgi:hypothetical protein
MGPEMDDLDALKIPSTAKVAGGFALLLGVFQCVLAAQTVAVLRGSLQYPFSGFMAILGLIIAYAGFRVTRGSGKAAIVALSAAVANLLTAGAWFVFNLWHGILSPLTFLVFVLSVATIAVSALAAPALRRVDAARARLRAQGLETGL